MSELQNQSSGSVPVEPVTYCYSYHRISRKRQIKGDGINRQIRESKQFCEQKGWVLDTTFNLTDIGKSAFHQGNLDDKAALGNFLKACKQGLIRKPAVLLVENLDRLSRANIMSALKLFMDILESGVSICTYQDRVIYSKESMDRDFGPLIVSITIMSRSYEESAAKSKRVEAAWNQKRKKISEDKVVLKQIYPHWITVKNGKPVIDEARAEVVREIFRLTIDENMSYGEIIKHLRDQAISDKFKTTASLCRLFNNKKVLGYYEPKKVIVEKGVNKYISLGEEIKAFPAIIEESTYFRAQAMVKKRINSSSGKPAKRQLNFFRGITRCPYCHGAIVMCGNKGGSYYRCNNKEKLKNGCSYKAVLQSRKAQNVFAHAISLINSDDLVNQQFSQQKQEIKKSIDSLNMAIEDKRSRINNLSELIEAGSKTGVARMLTLEKELVVLDKALLEKEESYKRLSSSTMVSSLSQLNEFNAALDLDDMSNKNRDAFVELLNAILQDIYIYNPDERGGRAILDIHLRSGIKLKAIIFDDYRSSVYNGSVRIGQYFPEMAE